MKPTTLHPAAYVFVLAGIIVLALLGLGAVLADDTPIGSKWWPSEWGADDQRGAAKIVGGAGAPAQSRDHLGHALAPADVRLVPRRYGERNAGRVQRVDA